jgi:hypothetical protein
MLIGDLFLRLGLPTAEFLGRHDIASRVECGPPHSVDKLGVPADMIEMQVSMA